MISVVIPVYNCERTLGEQLEALTDQTYEGDWEVILADNGSTDASLEVARRYRDRLPALRVVEAVDRRGAAHARNVGAAAAEGSYLAFCDGDDVVDAGWLAALARALERHDFVAGSMDHDRLNPGKEAAWTYRSHVASAPMGLGFLPYALSSNMAVTAAAFREVGGFPEDLATLGGAAGEDVALSWELQLAGHDLHFEPEAVVAYRHRHDLAGLWRQQVAYGHAQAVLYARYRRYGVPRSRVLGAFKAYLRLLLALPELRDERTRGKWLRVAATRWGRIRGSLRARVFYL